MNDEPFVENTAGYAKNAEGEQADPCEGAFKSVNEALKCGAERAKKAAKDAAPSIKTAVSKAAYAISFGAAYGGSFGLTLIKELVPKPLKNGGCDGFSAGRDAAENIMTPNANANAKGDIVIDADYSVS